MKNIKTISAIFISLFLFSCTEHSPEAAGKKYAEKKCDCDNIAGKDLIEIYANLLSEAKQGKYKSIEEVYEKVIELDRLNNRNGYDNPDYKNCKKELDEMEQKFKLEFVKDEDRHTLKNTIEAFQEACEKELRDKVNINSDQFRAVFNLDTYKNTQMKAAEEKARQDSIAAAKQAAEAMIEQRNMQRQADSLVKLNKNR